MTDQTLIFATRPSALARWQTGWVIRALQAAWPGLECREAVITTQGDRILDRPLPEIGGKGLFTQELEAELLSGRVGAAVHSLKDLPVENPPGLAIGAVPARADVRDVLVSPAGHTLKTLPHGARVGTSSLRRAAQLLAQRPDLRILPLRGNVDTRLRKARQGEYDAIVLAGAGLLRLGLAEHVTEWLPLEVMLPAPGQGALAVQCRSDDGYVAGLLAAIEDPAARLTSSAERVFLQGLGGGCALPVAAHARLNGAAPNGAEIDLRGAEIELHGLAAAPDGRRILRACAAGRDPHQLGSELADRLLAEGAGELFHA